MEIEFGVTKAAHVSMCHRRIPPWEYLNKLCYEGLVERYGDRTPEELKPRLEYELDDDSKTWDMSIIF